MSKSLKTTNFDPDNKAVLKQAFKAGIPITLGYLPASFAFGLMLTSAGYPAMLAAIMSAVIYTGAGQYMAVDFFVSNMSFFYIGVMTFLINSKHMFYGLSLLADYADTGIKKFYMIFALTDETYAVLTQPGGFNGANRKKYCFYVSVIDHSAWLTGTVLGAVFGELVNIDTTGLDFAMTALFLVILTEQLRVFKSKFPFLIGVLCALVAFFIVGRQNMLLVGALLAGITLIILQKKVEPNDENV